MTANAALGEDQEPSPIPPVGLPAPAPALEVDAGGDDTDDVLLDDYLPL